MPADFCGLVNSGVFVEPARILCRAMDLSPGCFRHFLILFTKMPVSKSGWAQIFHSHWAQNFLRFFCTCPQNNLQFLCKLSFISGFRKFYLVNLYNVFSKDRASAPELCRRSTALLSASGRPGAPFQSKSTACKTEFCTPWRESERQGPIILLSVQTSDRRLGGKQITSR